MEHYGISKEDSKGEYKYRAEDVEDFQTDFFIYADKCFVRQSLTHRFLDTPASLRDRYLRIR